MEEKIIEVDNIKADLNYEQLLGRAVDRCLFQRINSPKGFKLSVEALEMAILDLPGKPLRSELEKYLEDRPEYPSNGCSPEDIKLYVDVFKEITKILSKNKMLFKSTPLETNI